jgi:hypothetical protein
MYIIKMWIQVLQYLTDYVDLYGGVYEEKEETS